ncbi:hypothetical protein LTR84_004797 [Exophiala bonariae]|uniref:Major facilitator superfamily (MFS) profile domain-containing protein n=1 Tax=Exophiala bonariae TaxID=1690606 RepID=A0AAV9NNJ4_9EURO|nr:hypothetical protein LTR84_004797 [Exophiala bonariae]
MGYGILWTPPWCRLKDCETPRLTTWLTILYAFCGGFNSANLFYSHPILNVLAEDFHTTQSGVANIPTLAQAGEASCLLLILPLADFFPRRQFTLVMTTLAALFWLGQCLTNNLTIFLVLTYLSALFTCVVHVVIPLVSELSSPSQRAFNLSIVGTGPTFGILLARILSGIVANYTNWRNVYWMGLGIQILVLGLLFVFMPDYEPINKRPLRDIAKTYPRILLSIFRLYFRHPVLVQSSLLAFTSFTVLTAYWTTLTFLLSQAPYNYGSAAIGLFGLIGASTLLLGPLFGKFVITPLRVPLYSVFIGITLSMVGVVVGTFVGVHNVAGPVIEAVLLDAGLMVLFVAARINIEGIEPGSSNRVNTAFMIVMHLGQLVGTKAANDVYELYGGWIPAGCWGIGITAAGYLITAARGPYEKGWLGWSGGWGRGRKSAEDHVEDAEEQSFGASEVHKTEK